MIQNNQISADLFQTVSPQSNLLPYQGIVHYHGPVMSVAIADRYYQTLFNTLPWQHDEAIIYGKHYITARKVVWMGDAGYRYHYSGTTKEAIDWTEDVLELKTLVESISGTRFNSCLFNLYHNGSEGMAWHSDDEKSLGHNTVIASLSFGAERPFYFRHKESKEKVTLMLENGSLCVMQGETQSRWQHSLPKTLRVKEPRINLTFRTIVGQA